MWYVNLSIEMGKTSKKIFGPKHFYRPVQGLSKLKKREFQRAENLDFLLVYIFGRTLDY